MRKYQTEQRRQLLDFFADHPDEQFTIEMLGEQVAGISISAVYRNINQMVAAEEVRRFQKEGSRKFLYQYIGHSTCAARLHLKCGSCGSILHMDEQSEKAVAEALNKNMHFRVDLGKTVLVGFCDACTHGETCTACAAGVPCKAHGGCKNKQ